MTFLHVYRAIISSDSISFDISRRSSNALVDGHSATMVHTRREPKLTKILFRLNRIIVSIVHIVEFEDCYRIRQSFQECHFSTTAFTDLLLPSDFNHLATFDRVQHHCKASRTNRGGTLFQGSK